MQPVRTTPPPRHSCDSHSMNRCPKADVPGPCRHHRGVRDRVSAERLLLPTECRPVWHCHSGSLRYTLTISLSLLCFSISSDILCPFPPSGLMEFKDMLFLWQIRAHFALALLVLTFLLTIILGVEYVRV